MDDLESGVATSPQLIDSKPAATPRVPKKLDVQDVIGRPKPNGYPEGPVSEDGQSPLSLRINSLTREARKESISELREFVSYYKEGIATLQDFLIETIIDDPDISLDRLDSIIDQFSDELGLSKQQYHLFRFILSEYYIRHQQIEEVRKKYTGENGEIKNSVLFEDTFGFRNRGRVNVTFGPITMNFYCANRTDLVSIYEDRNVRELDPASRVLYMENNRYLNGLFEALRSPRFDPTLTGSIIAVRGLVESGDQPTVVHEEEHAITEFIIRSAEFYTKLKYPPNEKIPPDIQAFLDGRQQQGLLIKLREKSSRADIAPAVKKLNDAQITLELKRMLLDERRSLEESVKKEAISFLLEDYSLTEMVEDLETYLEEYEDEKGYMLSAIDEYTNITGESRRDIVERQVNLVFGDQFNLLVVSAVKSLHALKQQLGIPKAVALLRTVPLRRWPKEVERILQAKAARESELRKGQNIDEANS